MILVQFTFHMQFLLLQAHIIMFRTHKALRIRRHLDVVDFIDVFWEYNLVGHSSFCFVFESSFTARDLSLYPLFWVWTLLSGTLCDVHHFHLVILFYLWVCVCVLSCDCFVSCILSIEILSRIMCCFVLSFTYVWFRVFIDLSIVIGLEQGVMLFWLSFRFGQTVTMSDEVASIT